MASKTKRYLGLPAVALVSAWLAACGGGGGSDDDGTAAAPVPAPAPAPTPEPGPAPAPEPGPAPAPEPGPAPAPEPGPAPAPEPGPAPAPEPGPAPAPEPGPAPAPEPGPAPAPEPGPAPAPEPGPAPAPEPGPAPAPGSAAQCVDTLALVAGTRYLLDYQITGQTTGTVKSDNLVVGPRTFEGIAATEVKAVTTTSYTGLPVAQTEAYNYVGVNGLTALTYGGTAVVDVMGSTANVKTVMTPPVALPYDLAAGASFTQDVTYTVTTTITVGGMSLPTTTTTMSRHKTTFNGVEQITVPAGTFTACKFTLEDTDITAGGAGTASVATNWLAVGSGVPVRNESAGAGGVVNVMALTAGSINGAPIQPR
jgi:hypothetical protein